MKKLLRGICLFGLSIAIMSYIIYGLINEFANFQSVDFIKILKNLFNENSGILLVSIFAFYVFRLILKKVKLLKSLHLALGFVDTLEHELSHLIMGLLHFKLPHKLMVDLKGNGEVHMHKPTLLIFLAPYLYSLWLLISFILFYFLAPHYFNATTTPQELILLVGCLQGNFMYRLQTEIHRNQPDLREGKLLTSILFIFSIQSLWMILWFLITNPPSIASWFKWISNIVSPYFL